MLVFVDGDTLTNATLLNCWKFLIADSYQVVECKLYNGRLHYITVMYVG